LNEIIRISQEEIIPVKHEVSSQTKYISITTFFGKKDKKHFFFYISVIFKIKN